MESNQCHKFVLLLRSASPCRSGGTEGLPYSHKTFHSKIFLQLQNVFTDLIVFSLEENMVAKRMALI